ncbi:MAG: toprim domain-containing protein [Pirellula sp.]
MNSQTNRDTELFLVEGESAATAVHRVCNPEFQAVLAMQGKPMNAWKASESKVTNNALFQELIKVIDAGFSDRFELSQCRFDKIILLFDPDADGIHGCSLMLWFFYRWMPGLLDANRLFVASPPICELVDPVAKRRSYPRHPKERDQVLLEWKSNRSQEVNDRIENRPFRGLASLGHELLSTSCVNPQTRLLRKLTVQDAQASLRVFGYDDRSKTI